jgi:hypothetical protein
MDSVELADGLEDGIVAVVSPSSRNVLEDESEEDILGAGVGRRADCGGVGVVEEYGALASSSKTLLPALVAAAGIADETDVMEETELALFSFDLDFFGFFWDDSTNIRSMCNRTKSVLIILEIDGRSSGSSASMFITTSFNSSE